MSATRAPGDAGSASGPQSPGETPRWERVCRVEDLRHDRPVGRLVGTTGQDRDRVCVALDPDGEPTAMLDRCPHRDIALSSGVVREGNLVCPGHFWRFDLSSGRRTDRPQDGLTMRPTRVVDGWVEALLPAPTPRQSMRSWLLEQARERKQGVLDLNLTSSEIRSPEIGSEVIAEGVRTNYHDVGSGTPVVLVHGSGPGVSAWANWRLTLPTLSERHRVLAPDVLGFGYTQRPSGTTYDLDTWTTHLLGFLDALDLPRVALIGNSFGGALALALTTRHPDRVSRLVLMGSVGVPFDITAGLDKVWGFQPSLPNMRDLLNVFAYDRTLVDDELARLRLAAATRPGVQEAYAAMFPAPRQAHVDAMAVDEDLLRGIAVPTLIVHGRDDQVIPLATSQRLHQLIAGSRLQVFEECGHWVQIEHANTFNALVTDFLANP